MPTAYLSSSRVAYQRSSTLTASQEQLIVMLFDGARRFLTQASVAMAAHDVPEAHNKLRRAETIIGHLNESLDFERGGELAENLASLYAFWLRHLNSARVAQDPKLVDEVNDLIAPIRDAWAEISRQAA